MYDITITDCRDREHKFAGFYKRMITSTSTKECVKTYERFQDAKRAVTLIWAKVDHSIQRLTINKIEGTTP